MVAALAITQTIGYGTLYYAFAVLLPPLAADLHSSTAAVTGAFTASVLVGAALAVPVGRWLDRHDGRALMTTGFTASVVSSFLANVTASGLPLDTDPAGPPRLFAGAAGVDFGHGPQALADRRGVCPRLSTRWQTRCGAG